ncbi:xyloglucan endotransglucosylase/hydrolase protein 15-like [Actinidia eriantha]|uniref:xyloglucan endotransglucosylase/hydrolase protein 15-like n=1 Tax=Actinidia eriantha TaxID=165200 RepID=UPI002583779B|nr:xyloglucan endotransglucosylase/hydrolase protein 15-like [Actinidia eriantha]
MDIQIGPLEPLFLLYSGFIRPIIRKPNGYLSSLMGYDGWLISPPSNNPSPPNSRGNHDEFDFDDMHDDMQYLFEKIDLRFNVDDRPVRVFNNGPGINFASRARHVEASIWNVSWAGIVDWSKGPFTAYYQGFDIVANQTSSNSICKASLSDGTVEKNWELSPSP